VHGGERPARLVNLEATEVGRDALARGGPEEVLEVGQVRVVLEEDGVEERAAASFGLVPADEGAGAKALFVHAYARDDAVAVGNDKKEDAVKELGGESLSPHTG
jgi:hypothetical protein